MTTLVAPRTEPCEPGCAGVHAYLADGRRVCHRPDAPGRHAVDAELLTQPVPDRLAARWGLQGDAFWTAWTRAEALAKLTDTPITVWLRTTHPADPAPAGVAVHHERRGDVLICRASAA